MNEFCQTIIASSVGGIIGGVLALVGVYIAHNLTSKNEDKNKKQLVKGLVRSIQNEFNTLWGVYEKGVGSHVETLKDGEMLAFYYPITQDYFTVYRTNANLIGLIDNEQLKQQIIKVYIKAVGIVDSFRMNNDLFHKHETTSWLFNETKKPEHLQMVQAYENSLVEYAKGLKEAHEDLKIERKNLNEQIENFLQK